MESQLEFPARRHVGTETERPEMAHDGQGWVRLHRVGEFDLRRQGRPEGRDLTADRIEVVDVERSAKPARQVLGVDATNATSDQDLHAPGRSPADWGA